MPHTWYLGVEMQCFIITPLILWPLWKFPKFGLGFLTTLTVAGNSYGQKDNEFLFIEYFQQLELALVLRGTETTPQH